MPKKPILIAAAIARVSRYKYAVAVLLGRMLRYLVLGLVSVHYGADLVRLVKQSAPIIAAIVLLLLLVYAAARNTGRVRRTSVATSP
jgi:uncharacterized membrane protein YdjX (TVP38/TMEM64 family)